MYNKKIFGIVYKATNIMNGKEYVGQTVKTLERRKIEHKSNARRNKRNYYFYNAIRKYGWENFIWEVLCECGSRKELDEKEVFFIKEYNTLMSNGYNHTVGGEGTSGAVFTDEHIKKLSEAKKGKSWDEIRGKEQSAKDKEKARERMLGEKNPRYGKKAEKMRKYTDKQVEQVREYRKKGYTFKRISDIVGIKSGIIDNWCRDIKIGKGEIIL